MISWYSINWKKGKGGAYSLRFYHVTESNGEFLPKYKLSYL